MECETCKTINGLLSEIPDQETMLSLTFLRASGAPGSGITLDYRSEESFHNATSPLVLLHILADTYYNLAEQFGVPRVVAEGIVTGMYPSGILSDCIKTEVARLHGAEGKG